MKDSKHLAVERLLALVLVSGLFLACPGCQKIKDLVRRPVPERPVHESKPLRVYSYTSTVIVKATPEELVDYYAKDLSWVSEIEVEFPRGVEGIDMTRVGQWVDMKFTMIGMEFLTRVVTLRYKQNQELWLMYLTNGSWVLMRMNFEPVEGGSKIFLDVVGKSSRSMGGFLETFRLAEHAAASIDWFMATVQAHFDPEMDVDKVLAPGLRGNLTRTLLQSHQVKLWIDKSPEQVERWALDPDNGPSVIREFEVEESYYKKASRISEGEVVHGAGELKVANVDSKADIFITKIKSNKGAHIRMYMVSLGAYAITDVVMNRQRQGTMLTITMSFQVPESISPEGLDLLLALAGVPARLKQRVLLIKKGVEAGNRAENDRKVEEGV